MQQTQLHNNCALSPKKVRHTHRPAIICIAIVAAFGLGVGIMYAFKVYRDASKGKYSSQSAKHNREKARINLAAKDKAFFAALKIDLADAADLAAKRDGVIASRASLWSMLGALDVPTDTIRNHIWSEYKEQWHELSPRIRNKIARDLLWCLAQYAQERRIVPSKLPSQTKEELLLSHIDKIYISSKGSYTFFMPDRN